MDRWQIYANSLRCHSINSYCFSKLWFKCGSIDLRQGDIAKITSLAKSWVYADLLVKPDEITLYRPRSKGGLNLIHVKYRAMAEQIKYFIDTAVNPNYPCNIYHKALYEWFVEENSLMKNPGKSPYFTQDFFQAIKAVKEQESLSIKHFSIGMWYRALLNLYVLTEKDDDGFVFEKCSKLEQGHSQTSWDSTWNVVCHPSLESADHSFLFCLLHDLLPTQLILAKVLRAHYSTNVCGLCDLQVSGDQLHSFLICPFNNGVGLWLKECMRRSWPALQDTQVLNLNFGTDSSEIQKVAATWLVAKTFGCIWKSRLQKKQSCIRLVRAKVEADIQILRKSRYGDVALAVEKFGLEHNVS